MTDKKTMLLAQLFISLMMAASMSGIMSLIALGPTAAWLAAWPIHFAIAWPIAFTLTLVTGPLGFALAFAVMARLRTRAAV